MHIKLYFRKHPCSHNSKQALTCIKVYEMAFKTHFASIIWCISKSNSIFQGQGSLLFVTYTIIQGIIGSEMLSIIGSEMLKGSKCRMRLHLICWFFIDLDVSLQCIVRDLLSEFWSSLPYIISTVPVTLLFISAIICMTYYLLLL